MAPEVITGKQYDASADIWSFGITALELTQGRAPLSRAAASTVLTQVATAPPPKMNRDAGVHTYSAVFADIIAQCLQKDPSKRPTAQELLNSSFFKGAKKKSYLVGTVLKNLPPLVLRQEKRRVPSLMTHATMDSWDFSVRGEESLMASPTTSVHSFHSHFKRPKSTLPKEGVFELDDEDVDDKKAERAVEVGHEPGHEEDAAAYARRIREKHRSGSRSRSVSWIDSDDASGPSHHNTQAHPDPIAEVDVLSSSPRSSTGISAPRNARATPSRAADEPSPPDSLTSDTNISLSSSSSSTESSEAITPPQSVAPSQPKLWRRLVGRSEPKGGRERERGGEKEDEESTFRRKALGGVSILAGRGAGLVRTVSRVGTGE